MESQPLRAGVPLPTSGPARNRKSWLAGCAYLLTTRTSCTFIIRSISVAEYVWPGFTSSPSVENQKLFLYAVSTNGGEPEKVCRDDCGVVLSGASHDGGKILPENLRGVILVDTASGQKTEILKHPQYKSSMGRFSPDDRWISFHLMTGSATRRIFIAPFRGAVAVPESEWIPITNGQAIDRYTWWSPDGNLLYFISERDGFVCLWAQRLDPETKHPRGAAFPIRHFHAARRLLGDAPAIGMSVGAGRLVFSMTEQTGNIWMTNLP
jgi:eukaryotic-like serine/threonine-protein kinase